jgi:hypothetical protein
MGRKVRDGFATAPRTTETIRIGVRPKGAQAMVNENEALESTAGKTFHLEL